MPVVEEQIKVINHRLSDLEKALRHSLRRFAALGCCTSDHGYQGLGYFDPTGAEEAFAAAFPKGGDRGV